MSVNKHRAISASAITQSKSINKKKRIYDRYNTDYSEFQPKQMPTKSFTAAKDDQRRSKITYLKQPKIAEDILEQNINLKKFISDLQDQITLQRSKIQNQKKKNVYYSKKLNTQFSKQLYYSGKNPNSYMITGVKHQYEHIKDLYEQKCRQFDQLKKQVISTDYQQLKIYIQALEQENKIINNKLQHHINIKSNFDGGASLKMFEKGSSKKRMYRSTKQQLQKNSYLDEKPIFIKSNLEEDNKNVLCALLAEQQLKNQNYKIIIQKYTKKVSELQESISSLNKKINFLQKILIEKDNTTHHFKKLNKVVQKQLGQLKFRNQCLEKQLDMERIKSDTNLSELKEKQIKKFEIQKSIFQKISIEKDIKIQKLEKQIRFLSTLLSYWKPLDQLHRDFNEQISRQKDQQNVNKQVQGERNNDEIQFRVNQIPRKSSFNSDSLRFQFNPNNSHDQQRSFLKSNKEDNRILDKIRSKSQNSFVIESLKKTQIAFEQKRPRKSGIKHSLNGKKSKKLDLSDVKIYGQLIKYRLIGYSISIEKTKQLFSYQGESSNQDQDSFNRQYISMREIKQILKLKPFLLNEEESHLVSRYIVQDSNAINVYCDQTNEIERSIAKSIIKALIGDYQLVNILQVQEQWSKIKKIYANNMKIALKSIAPKGNISLQKFNELISGLGIEISEQTKQCLIGEMVKSSQSLDELNYHVIFENQQQTNH